MNRILITGLMIWMLSAINIDAQDVKNYPSGVTSPDVLDGLEPHYDDDSQSNIPMSKLYEAELWELQATLC